MTAVHHARIAFQVIVHQAIEQAPFGDPHFVRNSDR
jgi:hypothetical protein